VDLGCRGIGEGRRCGRSCGCVRTLWLRELRLLLAEDERETLFLFLLCFELARDVQCGAALLVGAFLNLALLFGLVASDPALGLFERRTGLRRRDRQRRLQDGYREE
jgi:hypothetical protein